MKDMSIPEVKSVKNKIPIIYLDTNVLIELSKHEKGCCTNEHSDKIEMLFDVLQTKMQENKILCAFGNQLEEMGTSQARENARDFLLRFTNLELRSPYQIEKMQLDSGYEAFAASDSVRIFDATDVIKQPRSIGNLKIKVNVFPICVQEKTEKLKEEKQKFASTLNAIKSNRKTVKSYEEQLTLELNADFQVFQHKMKPYDDSPISYSNKIDARKDMCRRVGVDMKLLSDDDMIEVVDSYRDFLLSPYHHKLPYVWISSVLFAHIMIRQNKVRHSDSLDITWASAYLPFVDYVVTDTAFCDLLNKSGLAELYGVKVYCFKTLNELLEERW